jgi:hypothetical protein
MRETADRARCDIVVDTALDNRRAVYRGAR